VDQQATGRERTGPGINVDAGRLSGSPGVTSFLKVAAARKRIDPLILFKLLLLMQLFF
jgi:hypothetical protein